MTGRGDRGPDDGPDDRDLLRAHVEGDADAFGRLFARHRDRLWSVALRTTGDPEEAADALQDALVAAFRRAETFRGEAAVTTWLHRIVVNACLDRHRRGAVRRTEPLPDDHEDLSEHRRTATGFPVADPVADPADVAADHDRRAAVLRALETLPIDQRAALVLVDMEGYSVEETAAILGCAPGTVKSRCSRGRAKLVPLLAPHRLGPGAAGNPAAGPRVGTSGERTDRRPEEVASDDT
jgi:RNA polymerase sigma-70 factor, ECF subfamily